MPERHRTDEERRHFDALATNYDGMFGYSAKKRQRKLDWLVKATQLSDRTTVLELGCGTGLSTEKLAETTSARIYAVDISHEMLRAAMTMRARPNIIYQVADVERLPFPPAAFDAVIGTFVLHHFNLQNALAEICRVCKPGARIGFCEPNMLNPVVFMINHVPQMREKWGNSPDETAFIRWELKSLLVGYGFEDITIKPIEFVPGNLPGILASAIGKLGFWFEGISLIREIGGTLLISASRPWNRNE